MKKDFFDKVVAFIENHFNSTILGLLFTSILVPVVVWLFYSVIPTKVYTEISADGILSYVATVMGSVVTVFTACVALYQSKKAAELEKELDRRSRQVEICPAIQVSVQKQTSDNYSILVRNASSHLAVGVYIYGYLLSPIVKANSEIIRKISLENCDRRVLAVDPSYICLTENGMPQEVTLVYSDIDNNFIEQKFRYVGKDYYEASCAEYLNE